MTMINFKTFGHKLSAVGTLLAGGSTATALITIIPADATGPWTRIVHNVAIGSVVLGVILSAFGKVISTWTDADSDTFPEVKQDNSTGIPPLPMILLALLCVSMLSGCTASVAAGKANDDAATSTAAVANQVKAIASFIATTWADHETKQANRVFNAAMAENSVLATITPPLPSPGTPAPAATVAKVVPEPGRSSLQAKHDEDLAQIQIGTQQIQQAVINQFSANLAAAQALQQGEANYYKTSGANTSTLQLGLDGVLATFNKFAPVIATALTKKK